MTVLAGERSGSSEEEEDSGGTLEAPARDPRVAGVTVSSHSFALGESFPPTGFSFPKILFSCLKHPKA